MQNHLKNQTSPYLLQHADNPVNWYPWCEEAFERARQEDKPILLSIGYSTCHWCHVMAHESFEDEQTAELLNRYFISIKVDKEERPDIDSIYMAVCQAFTGSGGWPTTIFLIPEQKPFYAGTYFPKTARYGQVGFQELLLAIQDTWTTDRYFLVPHFEKMLYDNALLILAYSEGVEGKYYLFSPTEIKEILGEEAGREFCQYYNITEQGNFEGKNIPNLLKKEDSNQDFTASLAAIYKHRKNRHALHLDDKILTSWNGLMIAAMCHLYRITGQEICLHCIRQLWKINIWNVP